MAGYWLVLPVVQALVVHLFNLLFFNFWKIWTHFKLELFTVLVLLVDSVLIAIHLASVAELSDLGKRLAVWVLLSLITFQFVVLFIKGIRRRFFGWQCKDNLRYQKPDLDNSYFGDHEDEE